MPAAPLPGTRSAARVLACALAVLVVLLLVGEVAARGISPLPADRTWPDDEAQAKADHAQAVADAGQREQVVFGGSSIADAAFDPAVVFEDRSGDQRAYNYAQEGSASATMADFLRAVVIPRVHPEVVVLGMTPNEINDGGTRQRELEELQRSSRGYRVAAGTPTPADRINTAVTARSVLLAHRQVLRDPYRLLRERGTVSTSSWNDPETGALLRHREVDYVEPQPLDATLRARQDAVWGNFSVGGHQIGALRDLEADLRDHGGSLVLVELPVFLPGFLASIPDGAAKLTAAHEAMVALDAEGCVERLDLRSRLQDERYWADPVHVNAAGTNELSKAVGAWLAERGTGGSGC